MEKLFNRIGEEEIGNLQCLIATYAQEYVNLKSLLCLEPALVDECELLERIIRDLVHVHNKNTVNHKYDLVVSELLEVN